MRYTRTIFWFIVVHKFTRQINKQKKTENMHMQSVPVTTAAKCACITYVHTGETRKIRTRGRGGGLPYKKGGDACWEISIESLKGTTLGVA